ncbi:Actin-like protein 6A [Smittium culicis]|uniref:Actin-like protein 6A n=1 Tax=Smittium culicis TaxID=133412 RepID=A0A1R1XWR9_9FUNG|nr:Actin-like protein 6A [Smittium culicis]
MPTYGGDEVNAVVFDIGSNNTRAGFAGEDTPYAYFSTDVGYTNMEFDCDGEVKLVNDESNGELNADGSAKKSDSMDIDEEAKKSSKSANKLKYHVGNEGANVFLSGMNVKKVVSSGTVLDWDAYERIISYVLKDHLHLNSSEHPVLFSEPNWNDEESREKLTELMFEKFNVPGFFVSKSAALSAFGTGKSTALVVDSGGETTSAVPVYDGQYKTMQVVSDFKEMAFQVADLPFDGQRVQHGRWWQRPGVLPRGDVPASAIFKHGRIGEQGQWRQGAWRARDGADVRVQMRH